MLELINDIMWSKWNPYTYTTTAYIQQLNECSTWINGMKNWWFPTENMCQSINWDIYSRRAQNRRERKKGWKALDRLTVVSIIIIIRAFEGWFIFDTRFIVLRIPIIDRLWLYSNNKHFNRAVIWLWLLVLFHFIKLKIGSQTATAFSTRNAEMKWKMIILRIDIGLWIDVSIQISYHLESPFKFNFRVSIDTRAQTQV